MGYVKHHAIVVTSWHEMSIEAAHEQAEAIFGGIAHVTPVTPPTTNAERSFMVAPDGSKEGWSKSDRGDETRERFIDWLKEIGQHCDWAEIVFGGDNPEQMGIKGPYGLARAWESIDGTMQASAESTDDD